MLSPINQVRWIAGQEVCVWYRCEDAGVLLHTGMWGQDCDASSQACVKGFALVSARLVAMRSASSLLRVILKRSGEAQQKTANARVSQTVKDCLIDELAWAAEGRSVGALEP